jgi:hypothetical protein
MTEYKCCTESVSYKYHSQNDDSRLDLEDMDAAQIAESAHIHQQPHDDICFKPDLPCGGQLVLGKCIWCLAGVCRANM